MCDKQVYDLTAQDIEKHGVWYFPMDETVKDELTVRPVHSKEAIDAGFQIIVRAWFKTKEGASYAGYIYWSYSSSVENLKPVVFVGGAGCISFWSGMVERNWSDYSPELQVVRSVLPVSFSSEVLFDLGCLSGVLEGLYSFKEGRVTAFA